MPSRVLLQVVVEKAKQRIPMSFSTMTSKARMETKRCTRRKITLRVKAALNLIVARGADYGDEFKENSVCVEQIHNNAPPGSPWPTMKFNENEAKSMRRNWILQGLSSSLLDSQIPF